jgi:hypothetical protein
MDEANRARAAALHFEAVLDGFSKIKKGEEGRTVKVTLSVNPIDVPQQLSLADLGTRWTVAMVEMDDDEQPINHEQKADVTRKSFNELPRSQQAGILCHDGAFAHWCFDNKELSPELAIYDEFEIQSRKELDEEYMADQWCEYLDRYHTETGRIAEAR